LYADEPPPGGDDLRRGSRVSVYRPLFMRPAEVRVKQENGAVYLSHPDALTGVDLTLVSMLSRVAGRYADRPFLIEWADDHWHATTYGEFAELVGATALRLSAWGVGEEDRVAILMRNSTAHAAIAFAVMARGGAVVPLSTLHYGSDAGRAAAHRLVTQAGSSWVVLDDCWTDAPPEGVPAMAASEVLGDADGPRLDLEFAAAALSGETLAKVLFTSGSTGTPKAVLNTHAMLTASAAMVDALTPCLVGDAAPVMADWLPWHHTYGGNINLHTTMLRGGTCWIDSGLPAPDHFGRTLKTLEAAGPTVFTSVPAAYPMLLDVLEADEALAVRVLRNLSSASCGGAALSPAVVERFQRLCERVLGARVRFGAGYGMTETGGILTLAWWPEDRLDLLGLPLPGVTLKLVPHDGDDRFECRAKGPNVFSGYPDVDGKVFDEEGYFLTGDAVRPADRDDWSAGLIHCGRLVEDFKLSNGTWVRAGPMREQLLAALAPHASEALIVGSGSTEVGAVLWAASGEVDALQAGVTRFNAGRISASTRIAWIGVSDTAPDPARGELTPKGTLNVRRAAENRRGEIDVLAARPLARF